MSNFGTVKFGTQVTLAPNGVLRTGEPTPLFDGKILDADNTTELFENTGTGTFTFTGNKVDMSVTSGQYCIRQSRRFMPYFSGYPLEIELTFDNMDIEANLVKRIGYFSSTAVSPYQSAYDGFWLEMDGTTYRIKSSRAGTETANVEFADWDGNNLLSGYSFNNFSAIVFEFLWLGGAALRLWVCTPDRGWILAHSVQYVGNNQDTITYSPNQPIRYEVISTTGSGNFRYVCSQVSVVGNDAGSQGNARVSLNTTGIACNVVGTIYALQGLKKNATYRDIAVYFKNIGTVNGATTDTGVVLLLRNPTLSGALTYAAYGKVDRAIATNQTVTNVGEIIAAIPTGSTGFGITEDNYRNWATQTIANTFDEYVLAYLSTSNNQTINGILTYKEIG